MFYSVGLHLKQFGSASMIAVLGLVILVAAIVVGVAGV
jgi:hypothetical protein